ncbi:putative isomerase YbhE [Dothidotthia symphoricarpi CBS 119687]|uniref:Putative isomerase YbhE n=1 Tax=Dothidotthia symphoricarpi CBS 119687 TaxID=1392245 RepID=A0A6A6A8Q8_9PLEO|nr:putative isomerase YbhE [Dothidotthia symphoricarpi CBS 119687]KAF2127031.1 putative isomerase YbhE [Dothidotthia symphoricarpi CBS 119687]
MCRLYLLFTLLSALWITCSSAIQLFAAHSDGYLSTLSLKGCGNASTLSVTSTTAACADNPSSLNLDFPNRVLYCLDRGRSNATEGSLNSFAIGADGTLVRIARVSAPFSGVTADYFDAKSGVRGYVTASYNKSAMASYILGANGSLTEPLQILLPTINQTGPVPLRQDRSYLHHVVLDPTNRFLLVADLGGDKIRVYKYDQNDIAPLEEISPLITDAGAGPRHAAFWKSENDDIFLFFNGELSQKVYSYRVEYKDGGLSWTKVYEHAAISDDLPATKAPTSEIAISPDGRFVVVSNRDVSFRESPIFQSGPTDTLSTFSIHGNGTLSLVQLVPSGGWSPRQCSFNKAGDMLAVGHQNNNTVVIWKRNVESGKIVREEDGGRIGEVKVSGAVVFSMWDE